MLHVIAAFFAGPATLIAAWVLTPQSAAALDFGFGFDGVEGIITALVDNTDNQYPGSVVVLVNPLGFPGSWLPTTGEGQGFSVRSGLITSASY
jgi:hypothetical protein